MLGVGVRHLGKVAMALLSGVQGGIGRLGGCVSRGLGRRHWEGIQPRFVLSGKTSWRKWIYTET